MKRIVVAGCGFVGSGTARLFQRAGWAVTGLTHSPESAAMLASEPFPVLACDITDAAALAAHAASLRCDVVIDCVSSGRGAAEYRKVYLDGARQLLRVLQPARFVFTSSTSVYAQTDGSLVTEESPAEPAHENGRILRETEDLTLAAGGIVARLAGIYGPGRSVLLRKFEDGSALIEGDGSRYVNQIHRNDAASALFFAVERELPSGIYNVADDAPLTQRACYEWLATRFARPLPPAAPITGRRKRPWTHKRVSNEKLRRHGWAPRYASFRQAVEEDEALLRDWGGPR